MPKSTEAERLVVQRVGQDIFRDSLLAYWSGCCPLTGIADLALLRASHIKPTLLLKTEKSPRIARRLSYLSSTKVPDRRRAVPSSAAHHLRGVARSSEPPPAFWPKTEALTQVMRHLGLFERDNSQRGPNLAIQINLVGPEPKPGDLKIIPR